LDFRFGFELERGRARVANVIVFVIVINTLRRFCPVARWPRERDARLARDDGDDDAED